MIVRAVKEERETKRENSKMDPEKTLVEAMEAHSDGRLEEAKSLLLAYYDWRWNDGFEPVIGSTYGDVVANMLRGLLL